MSNEAPVEIWIDPNDSSFWNDTGDVKELVQYKRADPPAAPTVDLKKRARQIIDAVIESPVVIEVRAFSQPEEVDRLEDRIVGLLIKSTVAPAAPDERDKALAQDYWPIAKALVNAWLAERGITLVGVNGELSKSTIHRFKLDLACRIVKALMDAQENFHVSALATVRAEVWRDAILTVDTASGCHSAGKWYIDPVALVQRMNAALESARTEKVESN